MVLSRPAPPACLPRSRKPRLKRELTQAGCGWISGWEACEEQPFVTPFCILFWRDRGGWSDFYAACTCVVPVCFRLAIQAVLLARSLLFDLSLFAVVSHCTPAILRDVANIFAVKCVITRWTYDSPRFLCTEIVNRFQKSTYTVGEQSVRGLRPSSDQQHHCIKSAHACTRKQRPSACVGVLLYFFCWWLGEDARDQSMVEQAGSTSNLVFKPGLGF